MSYLKSGEGESGRMILGKRIIGETSSNTFTFGASKPCSADKLLPPMHCMTRERSFRHMYNKFHPPAQIRKMDFMQRKEDPVVKKKREDIYTRIRAAESASERLKRDKEAWQSNRSERIGSDGSSFSLPNASSEHSSNEEDQDDIHVGLEMIARPSRERGSFVNGVVVSGFVADTKKTDVLSSVASSSGCEDINDDDTYGANFSFLSDWKKESKNSHRPKRSKQTIRQ